MAVSKQFGVLRPVNHYSYIRVSQMAVRKQFGVLCPVNHYSYMRVGQMAELSQTQAEAAGCRRYGWEKGGLYKPMMVMAPLAVAATTASITLFVPLAKFSNSNTPGGLHTQKYRHMKSECYCTSLHGWNTTHTHTHTHTHRHTHTHTHTRTNTKYICGIKRTIYSPILPPSAHPLPNKKQQNK